jgi:flavin-dependent dehydrogenase
MKAKKVIIIGAGPVGCYTAAILGNAGLKVEVFEKMKQSDVKKDIGIIHFDVQDYDPLGLPRPPKDHPLYLGTFDTLWQIPFDTTVRMPIHYPTDIVYMTPFINWVADYALKSGNVTFHYEHPFESPLVEGDRVVGARIGQGIGDVCGDLVIDCSGRYAVVRNALPPECGLPPLVCREGRLFRLHMERWKCTSDFPQGSNTYVSFKGFANQIMPDETLVGASTLKSWDETRIHFQEMLKAQKLDQIAHSVQGVLGGEVPYEFPPASLVCNGFLSIGDSAFQNKPFNGEGMSSGMKAAQLALPAILEAARANDFSRERLWAYNVAFYHGFGADFAMIRGTGETLVALTPEEFNWMFEHGFMNEKMLQSTWETYKAGFNIKMVKSVFHGFKKWGLFKKIIGGILLGMKLQGIYKKYPKIPAGLEAWFQKFQKALSS